MSKGKAIIFNAIVWGIVIVTVAFILRETPYKARVIAVLSLGISTSTSLICAVKAGLGKNAAESGEMAS
jgi:hypothetical protein